MRTLLSVPVQVSVAVSPVATFQHTNFQHADHRADKRGRLEVSVRTDTLRGEEALEYLTLGGQPVRRLYLIANDGEQAARGLVISDPDTVNTANTTRCGQVDPAAVTLAPGESITCGAWFPALPGTHRTTVSVSAVVPASGRVLTKRAEAGYAAVSAALRISESLDGVGTQQPDSRPVGTAISVRYTLADAGTVALNALTLTDPLAVTGRTCEPGGPGIAPLAPGGSANCSGTLTAVAGPHAGQATVTGSWRWLRPLGATGPEAARTMTVTATAPPVMYDGVPLPPPPGPQPSAKPPPPPPPPTPTPTPTPTPAAPAPGAPKPSVVPTPSASPLPGALIQPVGHNPPPPRLNLLLTSLVVVIVPAIMALRRLGRGTRR